MEKHSNKLTTVLLCLVFIFVVSLGVKVSNAGKEENKIVQGEAILQQPSTINPSLEDSMREYNQKVMESIRAIEEGTVVENDLVDSKTVNGYTLWEERFMEVNDKGILSIEEDSLLRDVGLEDDDIYSIINSLSYYCMKNGIAVQPVTVESCEEIDGLYHTIINVGVAKLDQIYEKETHMQRVTYIEGDDLMDKFGILAVNMDEADRERYTNTLLSYVDEGTLYSVKELNCCWYYLYTTKDNDNLYIRVSKKTRNIVERGRFGNDGLVIGEAATVSSPSVEESSDDESIEYLESEGSGVSNKEE